MPYLLTAASQLFVPSLPEHPSNPQPDDKTLRHRHTKPSNLGTLSDHWRISYLHFSLTFLTCGSFTAKTLLA
jgi:hypothetical protein